jgi:hypothetical protein
MALFILCVKLESWLCWSSGCCDCLSFPETFAPTEPTNPRIPSAREEEFSHSLRDCFAGLPEPEPDTDAFPPIAGSAEEEGACAAPDFRQSSMDRTQLWNPSDGFTAWPAVSAAPAMPVTDLVKTPAELVNSPIAFPATVT